MKRFIVLGTLFIVAAPFVDTASAQGTVADYQRAITLRDRYQGLAVDVPEQEFVRTNIRNLPASQNAAAIELVQTFEASCDVHIVADRRVINPVG